METNTVSSALLYNGLVLVVTNFVLNHLKGVPGYIKNVFLKWFSVTVEIPENHYGFDFIRTFLAEQEYLFRVRDVSVSWSNGGDPKLPPAPGQHFFRYRGRLASVSRSRRELDGGVSLAIFEHLTIRFYFGDDDTIRSFLKEAEERNEAQTQGLRIQRRSSLGWNFTNFKRPRSLSSVILPGGVKEEISRHINEFFAGEDWYRERGIPYRLGMLLHGEPGNGKTSLIKSLAYHYNLTINVASLSGGGIDDEKLITLFEDLPKNAAVVLEDIDCVFDQREQKAGESKVTFSGLLNALDGVSSSEGYVLFMTTNHVERLDPALIRPGRVDLKYRIGNVTPGQGVEYFRHFYGDGHDALADAFGRRMVGGNHSMAVVQSHLMSHRHDPAGALASEIRE